MFFGEAFHVAVIVTTPVEDVRFTVLKLPGMKVTTA
jgi:hypothetical protein